MSDSDIVKSMAKELRWMFWDFRCYFMHGGGNSIPFDFEFFKLAKNSEILFGDERLKNTGHLFTFKDVKLNSHLKAATVEEHKIKTLVMRCFFLRKELLKIKRGVVKLDLTFHLNLLVEAGVSYGSISTLEAIKRQVIWNKSSDIHILNKGKPFTIPIGGEIESALETVRKFSRVKHRGRDAFTTYLVSLFMDFYKQNGRYPHNKEVEILLEKAVGNDFIHSVDDEIEWGINGRTKMSTLYNKLVEVRKILSKKKSR